MPNSIRKVPIPLYLVLVDSLFELISLSLHVTSSSLSSCHLSLHVITLSSSHLFSSFSSSLQLSLPLPLQLFIVSGLTQFSVRARLDSLHVINPACSDDLLVSLSPLQCLQQSRNQPPRPTKRPPGLMRPLIQPG
jgi:hypothetical protein